MVPADAAARKLFNGDDLGLTFYMQLGIAWHCALLGIAHCLALLGIISVLFFFCENSNLVLDGDIAHCTFCIYDLHIDLSVCTHLSSLAVKGSVTSWQ